MPQTSRDELRRERLREYNAVLAEARSAVAVLMQFVQGREARPGPGLLEESFAAAPVEGVDNAELCPAAVWVALRQGDLDATLATLAQLSHKEFLVGEHEEVDSGYRLTTVEERRTLPDVELLRQQLAGFLHIPADVVAMIASWGPDDPRTAAEVGSLLDQRFGPVAPGRPKRPVGEPVAVAEPAGASVPEQVARAVELAAARPGDAAAGLTMSSVEFSALLQLTPEQGAVLRTLVRQAAITIGSSEQAPADRPRSS